MNMVLRVYNKETREAFMLPSPKSGSDDSDDCDFRTVSTDKYVLYLRKGGSDSGGNSDKTRLKQK